MWMRPDLKRFLLPGIIWPGGQIRTGRSPSSVRDYFDVFDWNSNKILVSQYLELKLIDQDFQPALVIIIWPDGREIQLEEITPFPI